MTWAWDPRVFRYRDLDTGRFLRRAEVLDYVGRAVGAADVAADQLGVFVADGTLSPGDFGDLFKAELKSTYIQQYLLGIGGREQMTPEDWGSVGGMLHEQYRHVADFVQEVAAGNLSEAQIQARVRMYTNSSREAFERAHGRIADKAGMTEELWVLGVAEHCPDCMDYAAEGWQPLGHFPAPGEGATQCLTNCQCHKAYRNPDTGVTL